MYLNDTIVAPATPVGAGAVAIVRMSGPRAFEILAKIWHPIRPRAGAREPRKLYLGDVIDPATGALIDRALAVAMPHPASLTGEDVAELQCHGGPLVVRRVVALAIAAGAAGARMAEPGEFTRRAFLNGRIDLAEAEAIADIVAARSDSALAQALSHLSGALSERVAHLRAQVIAIRAHLEVEIDFSDEDIAMPSRRTVAADIERLIADVALLHDSFARGRLIRDGVRATIVGKPNAGKSSILNLMLGTDRAIVTAVPGTTRDVIEDSIQLGPYALVLSDTAGVRESGDEVERIGIERTLRSARDADFIIAVFDSSRPFEAEDADVIALIHDHRTRDGAALAILNKQDLPSKLSADELRERGVRVPILAISAIHAEQAPPLRSELAQMVDALVAVPAPEGIAISRARHREALATALGALKNARDAALAAIPPEIVAVEVMAAADALGAITGDVSSEDVLDAIFREFCIGK
ncbi:MAG: tRNA uridine-5-carboxymethylaminomethyl(34) synthesis GTPase MnmE [Candidatus Binatus sp.]|uniref:tRNA uridine-5-carboxymethylaminomethyl(34) synthesis GTPase MnmE n=1 Tax=Candidatus Binatus sp. TaxID=2811406 RepID=UPI002724424C|nr:tRNA uridine-5-carboxymethylaminomethyl(34) synthesis GTPase MnmE [Candidatus Binatus sp.]MDO8432914.1 tRNA uridine-5-carboxymethylaminomethyl(34) synthesis GTPase MnmE [Candidatus Binatus sp.]